jgi:hypothetical protein
MDMSCSSRIFGTAVLAAMLGVVPAKAEKHGGALKSLNGTGRTSQEDYGWG